MTVTPLSSAPGAAGSLRGGLAAMHAVLDGLLARPVAPAEVPQGLVEVERLERHLPALRLRAVDAATPADVPAGVGQPATTGWLAETTRSTRQAAARDAAYAATALTLHDNTVTGRFTVPRLPGDILRKLLDAIAAPRRQHGWGGQHGSEQSRLEPAHARGPAVTAWSAAFPPAVAVHLAGFRGSSTRASPRSTSTTGDHHGSLDLIPRT